MRSFAPLIPLFIASSCGYHIQQTKEPLTVTVPYISGDKDGRLTQYLISSLSETGVFRYQNQDARYEIVGKIISRGSSTLGYEYRKKNNDSQIQRRLVPDEGRTTIAVEIELKDKLTKKTVLGPVTYEASSDYDFVNSESFSEVAFFLNQQLTTSLDYSLGQLDSKEGASLSSVDPCFRSLAQKVAVSLAKYYSFAKENTL